MWISLLARNTWSVDIYRKHPSPLISDPHPLPPLNFGLWRFELYTSEIIPLYRYDEVPNAGFWSHQQQ